MHSSGTPGHALLVRLRTPAPLAKRRGRARYRLYLQVRGRLYQKRAGANTGGLVFSFAQDDAEEWHTQAPGGDKHARDVAYGGRFLGVGADHKTGGVAETGLGPSA